MSTQIAFRPRPLTTAFDFSILMMVYHATDDGIYTSTAIKPSYGFLDDEGRMPLSQAASNGGEAVVKLLFANDQADVDAKYSVYKWTPMWLTAKKAVYGQTLLSRAAGRGHEAVVKLLLARDRIDVNAKDSKGRTPLWWAAEKGHKAVVKLLLANDRIDVNAKDSEGRTPLWWAAEKGHKAVVKLLLARDRIDVNAKDSKGRTPLWWAAEKGHEAVVKLLLMNDQVDVNAKDSEGRTPLWRAAEKGHEAVVKLLLANDQVDVNAKDSKGRTPLWWAAEKGHEAVVKLLLMNGWVDVNAKCSSYEPTGLWLTAKRVVYRHTPLSRAAEKGHEAMVKLLLANDRVDVNANDSVYGRTSRSRRRAPLSRAAEKGHEVVVKLLLEKGAEPYSKHMDRQTLLRWTAENDQEALVQLLLATAGVDLNTQLRQPEDAPPEAPIYLIMVWHIIRFLMFLARRLQTVLQIDLSLDHLSEFPNRLRPPCTTMPWNVRPALVVLWGVCWMFYSRPTTPRLDESHAIWESELLNINSDIPNELNQFQHLLNFFDQPLDLPQLTLEDSFQQTLGFEPFAISAPPDTWLASLPEVRGDFELVETGNISAFQASESSEQITMQPSTRAAGTIQNDSNGYEAFAAVNVDPTYTIQQVNPNNLLQSSMAVSSQHLTQSDLITTLPTTQTAGDQITRTVTLSQTSTNIDRSAQPPRDSEGRMICDRVGCGSITFPRRSEWKKHMDKHDRPYKCAVTDCTHSNGFSSKGDLERHKRAMHKQLLLHEAVTRPSNLLHYCPKPSCPRSSSSSSNEPFVRKDHLREHIKRKHKDLLPNHPASVQEGSNSPAGDQDILNSDLSGLGTPASQVHVAVPNTRKRRRLTKRTFSSGNADSANEEREEMEDLRRKVRDLERELELSRKREETLFDVIRKYTKQSNEKARK